MDGSFSTRAPGQRAKSNSVEQDAVKAEQQLMSPTVVLQWFPTLAPDVHVQLVLRIGKLVPPGKTMRIVVELDTRRRSRTS